MGSMVRAFLGTNGGLVLQSNTGHAAPLRMHGNAEVEVDCLAQTRQNAPATAAAKLRLKSAGPGHTPIRTRTQAT